MKYSIELLKQAGEIVSGRRKSAISIFEENKKIAYDKIPELKEIDSELSLSGSMISREVLSHKGDFTTSLNKIKERNNALIERKKDLLSQNGFSKDFLDINYACKKCNDSGFVDAMPCECLIEVINSLEREKEICSGEPNPFDTFDLKYYPEMLGNIPCHDIMQSIFENCKQYSEEFSHSSPNLLLFGGTGIGKTHISLAIAKTVQRKGFNVVYMSAPDLFTSLEKQRFNQEKSEQSIENILSCDLLVIDDLGAEFTTSFTISALYNIVNTRILEEKPTIITANLTPSEISQRYSDRIASRLLGCYEHLRFCGNDIRILKKKGL
ncbi:MAG: ATP-binding protein [Oscillospiraceae bacterium]|nr:ATP-binding protein [Oscillospiraceae bacterium]